jgi:hypothetical protein
MGLKNAPIPPFLIEKFAGKNWNSRSIRESVAGIESLIEMSKEGGTLSINAADLMLLLEGKVYEDYACNSIKGTLSTVSLIEIQSAVRARVLELTLQIEKKIPAAVEITVGSSSEKAGKSAETVSQITNQVIHGNYTSISNSGPAAQFHLTITMNDQSSVAKALVEAGISPGDAEAFSQIVASEHPESASEPFGKKAKAWIAKNLVKAANGTWKAGVAVATQVLTEAALRYYGLK